MKGHRKIILDALYNSGSLTKENICAFTSYKPSKVRMVLDAMIANGMVQYDEDDETYSLGEGYEPPKNWSFKELLEAWNV
jgi:DNA-binding IclR family transcriptional regulator